MALFSKLRDLWQRATDRQDPDNATHRHDPHTSSGIHSPDFEYGYEVRTPLAHMRFHAEKPMSPEMEKYKTVAAKLAGQNL